MRGEVVSLGEVVRSHAGNSTLIKGRLPNAPAAGLFPAYSAAGQDVWIDFAEHSGTAIIVSAVGARCGKAFLASGQWSAIANTHVVWPDLNRVDPEYLWFLLNREDFWVKDQAIQPFIKFGASKRLQICIPDLPTQRRIATRLKDQMAGVEAARKAVEEQQRAVTPLFEKLLSEAFLGITPLSLGIKADPAPPGWEWRRLMDVARLESGHTPSRRHPEYWENGDIPWLALPDIRALDCRIALETSEKTNALGIANSSARLLPENTVALSRTASVGFVTIFGRPMATSQDFVDWICGKEVHAKFLMWLLRAARGFIRDVSTGAIHKTVYMDVVERFHVCLPEPSVQASIAARLDEAFGQTESLRVGLGQQMEAVSALPGAYLREAFADLA